MSLFLSYTGQLLQVTAETDERLRHWFPEVDAWVAYKEADAWLWQAAPSKRPRNIRRFLVNWFKRERRREQIRAIKDEEWRAHIQRELNVGRGPS